MAFTVTQVVTNTVFGNLRFKAIDVTADAATDSLVIGMGNIIHAQLSVKNAASAPTMNVPVVTKNAGATGTSIVGNLALTNCVSGDKYSIIIFAAS